MIREKKEMITSINSGSRMV